MSRARLLALILVFLSAAPAGQAVEPDEILANGALEARARTISRELRCVVCQSQSIDDSNAPLAKDMRIIVRERLVAGDSDDQVLKFMVDRYGDYVLLKPPVQRNTIFLWMAPVIIFLIASGAAGAYLVGVKRADDLAGDDPSDDWDGDEPRDRADSAPRDNVAKASKQES
ncbi:MAG: cytochrome c-type biogenesis protein [Parvularculaceae bacterium]|nr:cytochrome c-type biogenesis protein CcmH [Parvularculaceae bacterium]